MNAPRAPAPAAQGRKLNKLGGSLILVSAFLYAFLGRWEGDEQLTVYADKLAGGLPTVCRGLTRHVTQTPIVVGEKWTLEKCVAEETLAIERVQRRLADCFTRLPPQRVFDMASSHAWNVGAPSTCASSAMAAWNRGEWELGCRRMAVADSGRPVWSYVRTGKTLPNGKPEFRFVQGLANRRQDEFRNCVEMSP